ncbi:MAG: 4-hydroxy-3-methylbut-2-enyl diphosphate reductase [Paludibacteraceae bacterium]|nr:4-hydroxy-3-methylbut-2-enyl diphosphate reductase [Paludibacteraceae bacterium]
MQGVTIEIDVDSGFCFGVVNAIEKAEQELKQSNHLYCLGDIVHNSDEVERLSKAGLDVIEHKDLPTLHHTKLLFRAHGEPPEVYQQAKANGVEIIDATCPVVLALQKRIYKAYQQHPEAQIVIYGKKGHAEVNGLVGQTQGRAIVVENEADLADVDFAKPIVLFSQTTKSIDGFNALVEKIKEKIFDQTQFTYFDTICRQVANRMGNIRKFAREHQLIFFVSGKKSSNGKVLFEECKKQNEKTYFVSSPDEIKSDMYQGEISIGICGATSTPKWQMEAVKEKIKEIINKI